MDQTTLQQLEVQREHWDNGAPDERRAAKLLRRIMIGFKRHRTARWQFFGPKVVAVGWHIGEGWTVHVHLNQFDPKHVDACRKVIKLLRQNGSVITDTELDDPEWRCQTVELYFRQPPEQTER